MVKCGANDTIEHYAYCVKNGDIAAANNMVRLTWARHAVTRSDSVMPESRKEKKSRKE